LGQGDNRSIAIDLDDGFGERLRGLLRQIVPDTAVDDAVRVFAREFLGTGTCVRTQCSIGVTFKSYGRHADSRAFRKPLFQRVIFPLTLSAKSPAVVVDDDGNVIRISEGRGTAIERRFVAGT
jgi:hypothetical protein